MKNIMKIAVSAMGLMGSCLPYAYGQAVPAGVANISVSPSSPTLPTLDGVIHYALSASEIVQYGYYGTGEVTSSSSLSGDVSYSGKSAVRPFSLLFAGGILIPNQGGQSLSTFQSIAVSQGLVTRHWIFNVTDSFSFLPQSPTVGLSGIPGVGDLGLDPPQGPVVGPAGGVLSISGDRISNSLSGSVERQLSRATSISGSGSWNKLYFLDKYAGLNSDSYAGVVALNRRIDQRSSVSVSAVYSVFSYSGPEAGPETPNFQTKGINVSYQRTLNREFGVSATIGPQWVSSSNSQLIPSSLNLSGSAALSYSHRYTHGSLSWTRGVNAGSGVLAGALSDSVMGGIGRSYGPNWVLSLNAGYTHSSGLAIYPIGPGFIAANQTFNTVYGGGQATRRISSTMSGYLSYTIQDQSNANQIDIGNALSGTSQTFGIGITYSPRSTHLGQF